MAVKRTFLRNDGTAHVPDGYFLTSINGLLGDGAVRRVVVEWVSGDVSIYEKEPDGRAGGGRD